MLGNMKPITGNISRASNSTSGIELSVQGPENSRVLSENVDISRISEEIDATAKDELDFDLHLETVYINRMVLFRSTLIARDTKNKPR